MLYEDDKLRLIYLARESEDFKLTSKKIGSFSFMMSNKNEILLTPAGINRFKLRAADIIVIDRKGDIIENLNNNKLPDDVDLHLVCYEEREDSIDVVIHINPEHASKRANEGDRIIFLSDCINPEDSENGDIASLIKNPINHKDYMLIKNNGVLVVGEGIFETLEKGKYIEEIAKIQMPKDEIHDYQFIETHIHSGEKIEKEQEN